MTCYQSTALPAGFPSAGRTLHPTEADCLNACKEGACCTGTTCSVKPQCQCQGAGQTFKGVGTVCVDSQGRNICECLTPSGCCCNSANVTTTPIPRNISQWANCLAGGCRPQQIDVAFSFSAPRKFFSQYVASQDAYYFWQNTSVTFSGAVTLTPFQFDNNIYTFAHDPSGTAGRPDTGLAEGFANASAFSIAFDPRDLSVQLYFDRKCTSTTLGQMEACNDFLDQSGPVVRGRTAGYGTMTTDTTPYNPSDLGNGFIKEYMQWTASLSFSATQLKNCFCYGSGTTSSSATEESYIEQSVLALPCAQRPAVINQQRIATDALFVSSANGVATLTINDAR